MKKRVVALALVALMVLCFGSGVLAADGIKTIEAYINSTITLKLNGEVQTMRNASGEVTYPIIYQETTYLPIRSISNMLGVDVAWDGATNTVILDSGEKLGLGNEPAMAVAGYELLKYGGQYGDVNFARYCVYDMNGDGREEIIIIAGTCEADAALLVYKYMDGSFKQVGSMRGSHSLVHGNSKSEGIIVHYGHMGAESAYEVTIKDGALSETELIAYREVINYTEFDYCVPLIYRAINDYTPFGR